MISLRTLLPTLAARALGAALGRALVGQLAAATIDRSRATGSAAALATLAFETPGRAGSLVLSIRP